MGGRDIERAVDVVWGVLWVEAVADGGCGVIPCSRVDTMVSLVGLWVEAGG